MSINIGSSHVLLSKHAYWYIHDVRKIHDHTLSLSLKLSLSVLIRLSSATVSSRSFSSRRKTACAASDDLADFGDRTASWRKWSNSWRVYNAHQIMIWIEINERKYNINQLKRKLWLLKKIILQIIKADFNILWKTSWMVLLHIMAVIWGKMETN